MGFGLGGRAGVGLDGFYVGVEGMYYFGSSTGDPSDNAGTSSDLLGADVGYSIKLPVVTIRPIIGIGSFTETVNGLPAPLAAAGFGGGSFNSSQSYYSTLYLQPGITAPYRSA